MNVQMMTPIDRALLMSEKAEHVGRCPSCHQVVDDVNHAAGCPHDEALAMRGYPTAKERDAARSILLAASEPTMPPPPPSGQT